MFICFKCKRFGLRDKHFFSFSVFRNFFFSLHHTVYRKFFSVFGSFAPSINRHEVIGTVINVSTNSEIKKEREIKIFPLNAVVPSSDELRFMVPHIVCLGIIIRRHTGDGIENRIPCVIAFPLIGARD